jgi:hypothetical protein
MAKKVYWCRHLWGLQFFDYYIDIWFTLHHSITVNTFVLVWFVINKTIDRFAVWTLKTMSNDSAIVANAEVDCTDYHDFTRFSGNRSSFSLAASLSHSDRDMPMSWHAWSICWIRPDLSGTLSSIRV